MSTMHPKLTRQQRQARYATVITAPIAAFAILLLMALNDIGYAKLLLAVFMGVAVAITAILICDKIATHEWFGNQAPGKDM